MKYIENKCNIFNDIFRNFEFGFYFEPPLHGVEENTIEGSNLITRCARQPDWRAPESMQPTLDEI